MVSFDTPTSWNAQDGYIRVCFPWIARMQWHPFSFYPVCSHLLSRRSTRQTAPRNLNALLQYEVVVGWFSGVGESCVLHCRRPAAERQDQFSLISFPCNMISLRPAVLQEHRSPQEQHPSDLHGSRAKSSIFIQAVGDWSEQLMAQVAGTSNRPVWIEGERVRACSCVTSQCASCNRRNSPRTRRCAGPFPSPFNSNYRYDNLIVAASGIGSHLPLA